MENTLSKDELEGKIKELLESLTGTGEIKITIEGWGANEEDRTLEGVGEFLLFARVGGKMEIRGTAGPLFRMAVLDSLKEKL